MIKKECIGCIYMCSCCKQSLCSTCRPYGLNFSPDRRKTCKVFGGKPANEFMFDVGEKVIIANLELKGYDGCGTAEEMIEMSGKEVTIKKRWINMSGRIRYYIEEDEGFAWSEPMFIPKYSDNRFDWIDKVL